ncbi:MAG TPA: enolase C-terminal domain-like protein [Bryobacteraceae bacterium]|nr:enolase C-terminal domain-like protein [Bryobacteraceae bacterium]
MAPHAIITSAQISAYTIPTEMPEADGTATWKATTIVVVELAAGGQSGLGYTYSHKSAAVAAQDLVESEVVGKDAFDIPGIHHAMDVFCRNWGRPGIASTAISAIDVALWDLKARVLDRSIVDLLGKARGSIQGYGSGGFTSYTDTQLLEQMTGWAHDGFPAVKMKIGRNAADDIRRIKAVCRALKGKTELYIDANGAYDRKLALAVSEQVGDLDVHWFEEPVSSDDREGLRLLVERTPALMKIAAGEYIYVLDDARLLIQAQAIDVLQADVTRCGGITNFMKIGSLCETYHLPLSAHTAPSLHAPLCCAAVPALNLEYFFDHQRVERMLFEGAIRPDRGLLRPDESAPGLGLALKRQDAQQFETFNWHST